MGKFAGVVTEIISSSTALAPTNEVIDTAIDVASFLFRVVLEGSSARSTSSIDVVAPKVCLLADSLLVEVELRFA